MRRVVIAFLLCSVGALLCFLALDWMGINKDASKTVSIIILGAFPKLHETLQKVGEAPSTSAVPPVKSFAGYEVNLGLVIVYVSVVGLVLLNAVGGLTVFVIGLSGGLDGVLSNLLTSSLVLTVTIAFPILFLCGRWIGRRCSNRPLVAAIVCAVLIRALGTALELAIIPSTQFEEIYQYKKGLHFAIIQVSTGTVLFAIFLLAGTLYGIKQRLSSYLSYLISELPVDSRRVLVDLAYDEAIRIKQETNDAGTPAGATSHRQHAVDKSDKHT